MDIGIRILTNQLVILKNIDKTDTFNDILNRNEIKKINDKIKSKYLKYNGKKIRNNNLTLQDYDIQNGTIIIMYINNKPNVIKNILFDPTTNHGILSIFLSNMMIVFLICFNITIIMLLTSCGEYETIENTINTEVSENPFNKTFETFSKTVLITLVVIIYFFADHYNLFNSL